MNQVSPRPVPHNFILIENELPGRSVRKTPRAELSKLLVTGDLCAQIFPRTLDLVARQSIVPIGLAFERRARSVRFKIELEALNDMAAAGLVAKIESQIGVRSVRWKRGADQS